MFRHNQVCLSVENLSVTIHTQNGIVHPVKDVSFAIGQGRVLGLVGESGSGKSLTAKAIMRLLTQNKNMEYSGRVMFEGQDLFKLSSVSMRFLRGRRIGMVFQDPLAALNPVLTIGRQLRELFIAHTDCSKNEADKKSFAVLRKVGLLNQERICRQYPHQLSGGMRQRVCIALAIALKPSLIIADEPTTALDVTLQAQILAELKTLQQDYGAAILLISHDMGVIAELADDVAVMRHGTIVEYNDCFNLFDYPQHEYTKRLLLASSLADLADGAQRYNDGPATA